MIVRYTLTDVVKDGDVMDKYLEQVRNNLSGLATLLGIKELEIGKIKVNSLEKNVPSKLEFQDEATSGINDYASTMLPYLCDGFSSIGVGKVSIEFDEGDKKWYGEMWKSTTDKKIDEAESKKILNDLYLKTTQDEASIDFEEAQRKEKAEDEFRNNIPVDTSFLYMCIADLMPLEGRDFALNPSDNGKGGVRLEPVAYTRIGKIWLEYLSDTLPQLSRATNEEERNMIIYQRPQ